jgi:hypothetical protein
MPNFNFYKIIIIKKIYSKFKLKKLQLGMNIMPVMNGG